MAGTVEEVDSGREMEGKAEPEAEADAESNADNNIGSSNSDVKAGEPDADSEVAEVFKTASLCDASTAKGVAEELVGGTSISS